PSGWADVLQPPPPRPRGGRGETPGWGRPRGGPPAGGVELHVVERVQGIGGELARHGHSVELKLAGEAKHTCRFLEDVSGYRGARRVGRNRPGTASAAGQRGRPRHRLRIRLSRSDGTGPI